MFTHVLRRSSGARVFVYPLGYKPLDFNVQYNLSKSQRQFEMKNNINKMKKKRKVSDTNGEAAVKKKKSKNQEKSETIFPVDLEVHKEPEDVPEEHPEINDKKAEKKEKKKKRKTAEALEDYAIEKKAKVNGNASTNEINENGTAAQPEDEGDNNEENTKVSKKEAGKLTGKSLRKSFNSAEGIDALRKFVLICKENKERDLAADYLLAGGGVLEILRLLDSSDKKNVNNASTVFDAMHIIIIKILAEYPQYQSRAEEACRHFINSHLSFVHSMLSSQSNVKHRKTVLRLLASMVSLGGSLPRELLAHLSFHSQVLDTLSEQTRPTDSQSVRTCFIHFVLSFLVEGNVPVIRALLEKKGMLSCIFPELVYDSHTIVHLVLKTIKTYVVENSAITKSSKLRTFSTPVLQSLVSLYNWKGPKNWPGPKGKKQEVVKNIVNPEEKEVAIEAVHDFLVTLFTSNRYGVIFHDRNLGNAGIKNNLVNSVLQSLDRPWEHPKPLDLVVRVLVACPDLIRSQLSYTEAFLEPRLSKKWILVMNFVGKIIESLDATTCLKPCLPELTAPQLINAVTVLTVPSLVLKNGIIPSLNNSHIIIRHEAVILLTKMLRQAKSFISLVGNNCHDIADFFSFKHAMTDYISKNVPSLEFILKVWSLVLKPGDEPEVPEDIAELIPKRHEHFTAILDLLQSYRDVFPERMDLGASAGAELDSTILLTDLNELPEIEAEELGKMKVKALEFLLHVDPAAFAPNKSLFGETLSFLIMLLDVIPTVIDSHARKTIKMLLIASGMFEGCTEQLDIWINSFANLADASERLQVANWFVKIVHNAIKRTDKYLEQIVEAEEIAGEQIVSAARLEDIFNELCERDSENSEMQIAKMLPSTSISPIFCSALNNVKKNPNDIFLKHLSYVAILTLHCQVTPGTLIHLTSDVPNFPAKKYLSSWSQNETPIGIKKAFPCTNIITKLSKYLLSSDEIDVSKFFEGNKKIDFYYRGNKIEINYDLPEYEVTNLLRLTVFYLTQFAQRDRLTQDQFDKYNMCLIVLLHLAKNLGSDENSNFVEECSRIIFMHPAIFQFFSPFCRSKNTVEKMITKGMLDVCQTVIDLNEKSQLPEIFLALKNKLISQLRSAVKKCAEGGKVKNPVAVNEFIEILHPTTRDIIEILEIVLNLPQEQFLIDDKVNLSIWGNIVPKLIEMLTLKKIYHQRQENTTIDANLVKKIVSRFTQLKVRRNVQMDVWDNSLHKFLESFPHNIAAINNSAFTLMLQRARSSTSINFLSFLVSRNRSYIPLFVKHVSNNTKVLTRSDYIFPIIMSNSSQTWTAEFLKKINDEYKQHVVRYFTEPARENNWVSKNVKATLFLIEFCIDSESCAKACEAVSSNVDKLDNVDINYVQLLQSLFKKSAKLENNSEDSLTKLVQFLVRITTSTLKKDAKNKKKIEELCLSLCAVIDLLKSKNNGYLFEDITKNYSWPQFTRFSLKLGLKIETNADKHLPLLKMLVSACDVAYKDASEDEYVKTLFEMTTSHSEFVNLMLSSQSEKKDLLELLWVLVRKNHSTMASSHIPLYLASYGATLSESDQLILMIFQHYESHKIKFNEYRPYLWGEAAATHYSVKGEADTALWRQPSTSQVLDLLDREMVNETIKKFPVNRDLKSTQLSAASQVYDPSFFLPLLSYLMSDNNVVACHKVTQGGALSLVFAACGSACEETRLAAYTVISRFYFHLEATSSRGKMPCIRIIDALRNGICNLDTTLDKARLSCVVSTFLARASIVTTEPMNILYGPLQSFLMAKPAMELRTIPELFNLLHSSDVQHKKHRHWILQVIRDGMKTHFDMELALKCFLFKMLLDFYTSVLSDDETKRLILEIIEATVKIPKAGLLLSRGYGLLTWLNETAINLNVRDIESVNLVVSIVHETLNALMKTQERDVHLQFLMFNVLKSLKPNLSKNTSVICFSVYTHTLSEIMQTKSLREAVNRQDLEDLVVLGKKILDDVKDAEDVLVHGSNFAAKIDNCDKTDDEISTARKNLRKLVLIWCDNSTR